MNLKCLQALTTKIGSIPLHCVKKSENKILLVALALMVHAYNNGNGCESTGHKYTVRVLKIERKRHLLLFEVIEKGNRLLHEVIIFHFLRYLQKACEIFGVSF